MNLACIAAWTAVLLLLPFLILARATETRRERALRLRQQGWSQQRIADRLEISRWKVRRLLA